jgi:hypothetical protein
VPSSATSSGWQVTDNAINVGWVSTGEVGGLNIELDSTSGTFVKGLNMGGITGTSGTIKDFAVPTPGAKYLVKVRGSSSGNVTDFSPAVQFTAAVNFNSLGSFLKASGLK